MLVADDNESLRTLVAHVLGSLGVDVVAAEDGDAALAAIDKRRGAARERVDGALIDVPPIGEEEPLQPNYIPKSLLVGIIQPRIEETFEIVRDSRCEYMIVTGSGS